MVNKRFNLEDGEIYVYDKEKGFTIYDPREYKLHGFDIESLYEHYLDKKKLLDKLEWYQSQLSTVFSKVESDSDVFKLIDNILSDKGFVIDVNGRLKRIKDLKIYNEEFDKDLRFYKIEDDKPVIDKERLMVLWIF